MKSTQFAIISSLLTSTLLVACGGGGSSSGGSVAGGSGSGTGDTANMGQFVNCPTEGLGYEIVETGETGLTGENGEYEFSPNSSVRFFLGKIELGTAPAGGIVMPTDIQSSENGANNVARFLETLDEDRNCDNGIVITDAVRQAAEDATQAAVSASDFDVDSSAFETSEAANFARTANGDSRSLISAERAAQELACAKNDVDTDGRYDGLCNIWFIEDNNNPAPPPNQDQSQEEVDALTAMFAAQPGDVILFGPGTFEFTKGLTMSNRENITIRGFGYQQTILDFFNSLDANGILLEGMLGAKIEDLTVIDTPGDSIKISSSDFVELTRVRAMWSSSPIELGDAGETDERGGMDPTEPSTLDLTCEHAWPEDYPRPDFVMESIGAHPAGGSGAYPEASGLFRDANGVTQPYRVDPSNGAYALYPVKSNNILMQNVIAIGASDAGIYVGQSNDIIIKDSEALFNVAGYEIENSDRADMFDNVAHCNTAGFLVFDLPNLNQYGEQTRIFRNYSGYNNQDNFKGGGGIVSIVPKGIGLLQLGYDRVEFFNNVVEWNRTLGFVAVSHQLLDGTGPNDTQDKKMDLQPEGIYIHDNMFRSNGNAMPTPRQKDPEDPESDIQQESLLPALVAAKGSSPLRNGAAGDAGNEGRGAHIVWDGHLDAEPFDCDKASIDPSRGFDADGKPDYALTDDPECRYNAYKFNLDGSRKDPKYWICEENNTFSVDSRVYINFNGQDPQAPANVDRAEIDCVTKFGEQLQPLPAAVVEPYRPGVAGDAPPSALEIAEICENHDGNGINRAALPYNCKNLSHYNLFEDQTDPTQGFVDNGMLYDLNTALFSDYASKYRVLYLPPGEKAQWLEGSQNNTNGTLRFPVGTVIAKTFSFKHDDLGETIIETRLLIHREGALEGRTLWEGLPYVWREDMSDADLFVTGTTREASWKYTDPDPDVNASYEGSTVYSVPSANQCGLCHNNDDLEAGDAPIGPKVRNLNMPVGEGQAASNQLQLMIERGLLEAPGKDLNIQNGIAMNARRVPRFNVASDSGNIPIAADEDEQARFNAMTDAEQRMERQARAWLEVNCAHCHNVKGGAASTGLLLDVFRPVDNKHGICKTPTTSGSKGGGASYLITPGSAGDPAGDPNGSVLSYRIHAQANADERMPPLARSVKHAESTALIDGWINAVVDASYTDAACAQ